MQGHWHRHGRHRTDGLRRHVQTRRYRDGLMLAYLAAAEDRTPIALPFPEPLGRLWRGIAQAGGHGWSGPVRLCPLPALRLTGQSRGISASHAHWRITRHTRAGTA